MFYFLLHRSSHVYQWLIVPKGYSPALNPVLPSQEVSSLLVAKCHEMAMNLNHIFHYRAELAIEPTCARSCPVRKRWQKCVCKYTSHEQAIFFRSFYQDLNCSQCFVYSHLQRTTIFMVRHVFSKLGSKHPHILRHFPCEKQHFVFMCHVWCQ